MPEPRVPDPVRSFLVTLRDAGHRAWLTGEGLLAALRQEPTPSFEVLCTAPLERLLELSPRAIPTRPRDATATVPTAAGPLEVACARHPCPPEGDLAHRDFTVHAIAWDPLGGGFVDPWQGLEDLGAGRLRCPGRAAARLGEQPVRALRAARVAAETGFVCDAELLSALAALATATPADPGLDRLPALPARHEIDRMLLARRPSVGLTLLRSTGIEAALAPGARADAGALIESGLPPDRDLRLAAWLRGAPASSFLRRFRYGAPRSDRIRTWLELHPIDEHVDPRRDGALRRLGRRLGEDDLQALLALRSQEIALLEAGPARRASEKAMERLRHALARVRSSDRVRAGRDRLALTGGEVMEILGCEPGPAVGAALRALGAWVDEDPDRNRPERLRQRLREREDDG